LHYFIENYFILLSFSFIVKVVDEIVGFYGVIAILLAYALISFGVFTSSSILYYILNGTGALGIMFVSFKKKAYQPAVLNIIWTIVAIVGILNILL